MGKSYACRDKSENKLREGDFYPTPCSCVTCAETLFKEVIPLNEVITDPCCGDGAITYALHRIGYGACVENDFFNDRENILHEDVLKTDLDVWTSPYIVTNFPFSNWDDCVMAFLAKKDLKALITIGRLNYLSTQSRLEGPMWKHLKELWVFSRYIDYRTEERFDGQFHVGAMASGWFYFTKEEVENPVIKFVDVQKYATLGMYKKNMEET